MSMDNAQLCIEGVSDLIITAKGMYETLSLHYFGLQKLTNEFQRLVHELQKSAMYNNS
ncbi:hypothetical protein KAM354_44750 [Aeromonas caviae]|nr:hypothetical protein KAM354_44750 [Aeromonas caviae]